MSFEDEIYKQTGYKCITTFWSDFSIAEMFGMEAIKDTFNRAFKEWRTNIKYFTELVLVLNHKIWFFHGIEDEISLLYNDLWREADSWAYENITDPKDAEYYYSILD